MLKTTVKKLQRQRDIVEEDSVKQQIEQEIRERASQQGLEVSPETLENKLFNSGDKNA